MEALILRRCCFLHSNILDAFGGHQTTSGLSLHCLKTFKPGGGETSADDVCSISVPSEPRQPSHVWNINAFYSPRPAATRFAQPLRLVTSQPPFLSPTLPDRDLKYGSYGPAIKEERDTHIGGTQNQGGGGRAEGGGEEQEQGF